MAEQKHTHDPLNVDEALSTSEAFLLKYKNLLVGIVVAIVVIVCGTLAYKHFIGEPKELKASEALFKGEQYFGNDNYETALKGDSLGYAGFLKIADEFSGTEAGNLANAYAGIAMHSSESMKKLQNIWINSAQMIIWLLLPLLVQWVTVMLRWDSLTKQLQHC